MPLFSEFPLQAMILFTKLHYIHRSMVPRVVRSVLQGQTFLSDYFCRRGPLHISKHACKC